MQDDVVELVDREDGVLIRARLPHRELRRYARYLVAEPPESATAS